MNHRLSAKRVCSGTPRTGWLMALFLCLIVLLTGCSGKTAESEAPPASSSEDTGDQLNIGISFDSFVIERWLRDRDVFTATAQSLGARVNVQNANGDVEEQISQIEYLIDKKMDVIAIIAIDGDALVDVVNKAQEAGIKVISYDRLIRNSGCDLYISFDNRMVGTLMGQALAESLPDGGEIFQIQGSESDNNVAQAREGFEEALEGTGITITYSTFCENWLAELAFDAVTEGLQANGNHVDGIMCGNDDLAGQAIRALTEQKMAGEVPVVAQDAELSACQRIVEGTQTMTVYKSVDQEASAAAKLAVALGNGEDITDPERALSVTQTMNDGSEEVPYYALEPVAVTKDNLDEVIIAGGFHQREDVYLNVNNS